MQLSLAVPAALGASTKRFADNKTSSVLRYVSRRPVTKINFRSHHFPHLSDENLGATHHPVEEGLGLSLFMPYNSLPPDGATLPATEELCDPMQTKCKTPTHVYEARCVICYGTGMTRGRANGRRGHLGTCMQCLGLGYVRRTTARFQPEVADEDPAHIIAGRPTPTARDVANAARLLERRAAETKDKAKGKK